VEIKRNFPPTMPTCRDEHLPTRPFASPTQPVPSHLSEEAVREKLLGEEVIEAVVAAKVPSDCRERAPMIWQRRFDETKRTAEQLLDAASLSASSDTGGAGAETFIGIRPCALNRDGFHRTQRVSKKCRSCGESETGLRDPIAPLREAVTDLQGVVYSPPGPPPADLDKALSAVARCVDRLDKDFATSPQQSVPDTGTKGGPRYPVPDPPREVPGREGEVVGPCAEECGCPLPAIVRDDGTCSGCGSQVVPPANPSSTTRGGQ
jgi:hypothetical protein